MNKQSGFTIIEIFVVAIVLIGSGGLFLYQKNHIQAIARDDRRKADINTIYHNLEKVYYAKNKAYPQNINEKTLPGVQPDTFKDPNGIVINESKKEALTQTEVAHSDYSYRPKQCDQTTGKCKSYELQTRLEQEADYKKQSDNK